MKKRFLSLILVLLLLLLCSCGKKQTPVDSQEANMAAIRSALAQLESDLQVEGWYFGWLKEDAEATVEMLKDGVEIGEPIKVYRPSPSQETYLLLDLTYYPVLYQGACIFLVEVPDQGKNGGLPASIFCGTYFDGLLRLQGIDCPKAFVVGSEFHYLYTEEYGFEKWWPYYNPDRSRGEPKESFDVSSIERSNALTENGQTWPVELGE